MQDRGRAAIIARLSAVPRIGLRQLLVGLALACILPLAIVATVLLVVLWRAQQAQLHDSMRATAHALALSVEQRIESTQRRLRLLASLEGSGFQHFGGHSAELLAANPDWSHIAVAKAGEQPHEKKVFAGEAAVSDLVQVPERSDAVVQVGVPLFKNRNAHEGLFVTLEPTALSELLRVQLSDPRAIAGIVDGEYRIIARTRDVDRYVGKRLVEPLDAAVRAQPTGVGRFPASEGPELYSAWSRVGGTGWTLILGTPAAPADAPLRRSFTALGGLLVIVLFAGALFAWLIGRRLAQAIHSAADAAVKLSAGERVASEGSRIAEVQLLVDALEGATARLAAAHAERRRAEAERDRVLGEESRARAQAEAASRAKDEFLAMLGHELRNPLGALVSAARVVDRLPASSADHKAAREVIARQSAHLAKLVDDLVDVGRVVSGRITLKRHLVDLAQATAAAVATTRSGESQAHQWELELQSVLVSADPTRIDQVLGNLLANAVKFTPAAGRIRVRLFAQADEAVLAIEDTGPGISPGLLPHIFDPFTGEGSGLGIGLALVRRLVELHGGKVSAENTGSGARFIVRLPAIPQPHAAPARTRASPAARPARQARVLIVEDNDDARVTLQRILQHEGHLVSAARDGAAGLEAAQAGSPNVAIVDIGLPGMDGYAFARAMRERLGSGVRLFALTGYGAEADRQRAAEAGFDAHLTKPVDIERLLALIAEAAV